MSEISKKLITVELDIDTIYSSFQEENKIEQLIRENFNVNKLVVRIYSK